MKEEIKLIFDSLKNKELTLEQAEQRVLDLFGVMSRFYELGKREVSIGEQCGFPLMKINKSAMEMGEID